MSDTRSKKFGKTYASVDASNIIDSGSRRLRTIEFTDYGKVVGKRSTSDRKRVTKTRKFDGEKEIDNNIATYVRPEDKENDLENISSNMKTLSIRKNPRYKQKDEESSPEKEQSKTTRSSSKDEGKNTTRLRRRQTPSSEALLSDEVMAQVKRLLGKSAKISKKVHTSVDAFMNMKWDDKLFNCEELDLEGFELGDLHFKEAAQWSWVKKRKNALVIADIENVAFVATAPTAKKSPDFNVVLCRDEDKKNHEGPWKLSEFLAMLEPAE